MPKPYEAPTLQLIGSVAELTLSVNKHNSSLSDGFTYYGEPINNS